MSNRDLSVYISILSKAETKLLSKYISLIDFMTLLIPMEDSIGTNLIKRLSSETPFVYITRGKKYMINKVNSIIRNNYLNVMFIDK